MTPAFSCKEISKSNRFCNTQLNCASNLRGLFRCGSAICSGNYAAMEQCLCEVLLKSSNSRELSQVSPAFPSAGVIRNLQAFLSPTGPSWSLPFSFQSHEAIEICFQGKPFQGLENAGCKHMGTRVQIPDTCRKAGCGHTCL